MEVDGTESSPAKLALSELERIKAAFREALVVYGSRVEAELDAVGSKISKHSGGKKLSSSKMRDLRDLLTVLRNVQIKADKGRRKDIKKIDAMVGDLNMLLENW